MQRRPQQYDRAERIGSEIRQVLAPFFRENMRDPRVQGIQITNVTVTKDLKLARVYYFIRGGEMERSACQHALEKAAGLLKRAINSQIVMKYTPALQFFFDDAIEYGEKVSDILEKLEQEKSI